MPVWVQVTTMGRGMIVALCRFLFSALMLIVVHHGRHRVHPTQGCCLKFIVHCFRSEVCSIAHRRRNDIDHRRIGRAFRRYTPSTIERLAHLD